MNLSCHQARMERTVSHFFKGQAVPNLNDILSPTADMHFYKARVVYGKGGIEDVQYAPYTMRTIKSLKVVRDDTVDYSFKSTDRTFLNRLVSMKGDCDEIIIVKNGLVTDTSFTNIAVYDGDVWLTNHNLCLWAPNGHSCLGKVSCERLTSLLSSS